MINLIEFEKAAVSLEESGEYRVLRKLKPRMPNTAPQDPDDKLAIFVDVETTGLDPKRDEIIELALIPFRYSAGGNIKEVLAPFHQLQEPLQAIPDVVTAMTGISNEMVADRKIDSNAVTLIVKNADLVIAHNAAFDRRFVERCFPIFSEKPWACSMSDIDWACEGFGGSKLTYLCAEAGFFYERHRAVNDCFAAIELLERPLPKSGSIAMAALLDKALRTTWRIWAEASPFELKKILKNRGYRWNGGENGKPRSWYCDASEDQKDAELSFLRSEIYNDERPIKITKITAFDRYSDRV